jgi:hypothetical protein
MRRWKAAAATLLVLAGCSGGGSGDSGASATLSTTTRPSASTAIATTTTVSNAAKIAYARALLEVRQRYLNSQFTAASQAQAADALNLITPPPDYLLRHKALIDDLLAASKAGRSNPIQAGSAEGKIEADLVNLAHDADTNSGY